jgi:hypothetical protein
MHFSRYMDTQQFARELESLRAYRSEYVGDGLLESLEVARLLIPRVRIRFPDPVARRFWAENHEWAGQLKEAVEPDGPRWDAAEELRNGIFRWSNHVVYGVSGHPLDDSDPRFAEFIVRPETMAFQPWLDMHVDVSNEAHSELFDSGNVGTYYSSWQVLVAAEVADAGVHFTVDLTDKDVARTAREALREGIRASASRQANA